MRNKFSSYSYDCKYGCVLFFKNGEIVDKQVGAVGKPVFVEKVKNLL